MRSLVFVQLSLLSWEIFCGERSFVGMKAIFSYMYV
ncbi:hypothetical protein H791_YJM1273M00429 [Saccharomyces cerevisiae YJM1273]|nr:hypothetical protein H791_YJM1273M00429 [Saccharomyces cerevisiae YJM1273]AJS94008.1 hypothetical protein H819_YJM1434M00429 [Saccharomyces cerevisiae YJM1434]